MTLSKGFLRPRPLAITSDYGIGISLGIGFSFGLYALFYLFREGIRIMSVLFPFGQLLELTPLENFWLNLFYSSISVILGFYVFVKLVIEDSFYYQNKKTKLRLRYALNDQSFFFWSFLGVFGRLASVLGILFLVMPLHFDIDFLKDYSYLLILIPVVLYLNIWPPLQRLAGREVYKWFLYATPSVIILSLLYANINFIDYKKVNRALKKKDVILEYGLRVPTTESHEWFKESNRQNIYMLMDPKNVNEPLLFIGENQTPLRLGEVHDFLKSDKNPHYSVKYPKRETANLHIDKNISLSWVNLLKDELRKAGILHINYSTAVKNSIYPSHYPGFKYSGMPEMLQAYYPDWISFLDSAENIDLSKNTIGLRDSGYYRPKAVKKFKRIKIEANQDQLFLNGRRVSKEDLKDFTYKFIRKYSPDHRIIFEPEENITYGRYLEVKDIVYSNIDSLRNELALKFHNMLYEDLYYGPEAFDIRTKYPKYVVEWTPEEKRLMQLMKKQFE